MSLHRNCSGSGLPPVIFESGLAASSITWTLIQPEIATLTQTCSYDRGGLGYSPAPSTPRTLENICTELRQTLVAAGIAPPYILVGHSYGGLILRYFAQHYRAETAGLVFVDPVSVGEWCNVTDERRRKLEKGIALSRRGGLLARLGIVRLSLALLMSGSRWMPKLVAKASSGPAYGLANRIAREVGKLPRQVWPSLQRHWSQPKCFYAMAEYLRYLPQNAVSVSDFADLRDIPVVVISAGEASPAELEEHAKLAQLSSSGRHLVAERSGHWIPFDRPDIVIEAVRSVVDQVRGA